jgi:hypothetical protein
LRRHGAQRTSRASPSRLKRRVPNAVVVDWPSSTRSPSGEVASRNSPLPLASTRTPGASRTGTVQAPAR